MKTYLLTSFDRLISSDLCKSERQNWTSFQVKIGILSELIVCDRVCYLIIFLLIMTLNKFFCINFIQCYFCSQL